MKNAQLKLTEVDDDELWLPVRLAHGSSSDCSDSSDSSDSGRSNQPLRQLQPRSLSTKHQHHRAHQAQGPPATDQHVACHARSNDQRQHRLDSSNSSSSSNMLSPQTAALVAVAATQKPTTIRLCARKRNRLRRRRKRKPATPSEAAASASATTSNSSSNLHPTATYMQCRTSDDSSSTSNLLRSKHEPSPGIVLLQVLHVLQVALLALRRLRGSVFSTTAFICHLGRRSRGPHSARSGSTQIINGLSKHSWIFLLIYLNLSAKGECHQKLPYPLPPQFISSGSPWVLPATTLASNSCLAPHNPCNPIMHTGKARATYCHFDTESHSAAVGSVAAHVDVIVVC